MSRLFAWLAAAAFALLLGVGVVAARPATPAATIPKGPAVVVVAPARPSADDLESEAYADWSAYLADYLRRPVRPPLVRMTPARWRQLARAPLPTDDYATVFLRADGAALVHHGMVLELQVYLEGERWTRGRTGVPAEEWGLVPARLLRR